MSCKDFSFSENAEGVFKFATMTGDGPTGTRMVKKNLLQRLCQQWEQLDNIGEGTHAPFHIPVQQVHPRQVHSRAQTPCCQPLVTGSLFQKRRCQCAAFLPKLLTTKVEIHTGATRRQDSICPIDPTAGMEALSWAQHPWDPGSLTASP